MEMPESKFDPKRFRRTVTKLTKKELVNHLVQTMTRCQRAEAHLFEELKAARAREKGHAETKKRMEFWMSMASRLRGIVELIWPTSELVTLTGSACNNDGLYEKAAQGIDAR